ncbi:hypothetical protein N7U66_08170 [Lacinutrix neustonica]|uniref:Uncharacterized protein n=1 Tax=Lacinutrix neustonica TaxID=2980107 RepID=A0A9E8MYN9_9FLAO|nr:hypothetical protein [Lacinutrix neustonica]WAC03451.1 hypothetical protein N7U66_08170 [Lacinutrix neustonica]
MKTKLTLLIAFCLLLLACPASDDDTPPPIEITATNYLFEAEVTQEFYAKTLADLQQNDPNNTAGIQEAEDNLNSYTEFLDNLIEIVGIGVLPPPPPCPR